MTVFVGRLQERRLLRVALEDRAPRLVVVRGPSGIGKTALVEQVLQDLSPAAPIVGRAKYAEQSTSAGLRPVVEALSQAVDAALDRLYDPISGVTSLRNLLGAQYDTLLAAGFNASGFAASPALAMGASLQSREGSARLVDALVRVLQWLEGFALPVILFVDDWHRAPNEAVGFVHACGSRGDASALKLVLAARNEGPVIHPKQATIVELAPLAGAQQLELVTALLGEPTRAAAVMEWLGDHASGLPFDLSEIALALSRAQAFAGGGASVRVDPMRAATIDHRDIDKVIVERARTLSPPVRQLGIAAALWGDRADLEVLARCLGEPDDASRRAAAELEAIGLLRITDDEVAFPHDRIRASLLRVPEGTELRRLAHAMADALLAGDAAEHRRIALSLRLAGGLDDVREPRQAILFATEAASARHAAQFDLAAEFGEAAWVIGQRLGPSGSGERLAILREACFAAAHRRQAETTRERIRLMIEAATDRAELADAYERGVIAMRLAGTWADAWALCREGVTRFGIHLPDRVTKLHLALAALIWRLVGRKARRVIRLDARTVAAITSFANSSGFTIWERGPQYAAYNSIQAATRARLMGDDSALWLSVDSLIYASFGQYAAAAEAGDRALARLDELTSGRGWTIHRAIYFGKSWRDPRALLVEAYRSIYDHCIAENDLLSAANAVLNEALGTWRSAPTLAEVVVKLDEAAAKGERLADARILGEIALLGEMVRRLRQPIPLSAGGLDEFMRGKVFDVPSTTLEYLSLTGDWSTILRLADEFRGKRGVLDANPIGVSWRFYENLARLKTGLALDRSDLRFVERAARANPTDQLGKFLLLRAEQRYRRGKRDCLRLYAEAVNAMQKGSSCLELGLAAECAAAAAQELGDGLAHERFRRVATETWSAWGAFGKLATYRTEQLDSSIRSRLAEVEAEAALARRGERAKSRFLAEVGHELRTPLQAMQGLLDLASERPHEVDLGEMREVFGSLKSVVDDLTELGALGAEAPLNARTVDLAGLLASELGLIQEAARAKGLVLSSDLVALDGAGFDVDPDRVRQAVRNLLSNAVKYTEQGGVRLQALEDEVAAGRSRLSIIVDDTGPGIPPERWPHLFEPFDRAGRGDSRGLGLGLSLSRRIAERMGGSLGVENRPEGGARFTLCFPAAKRPALALSQGVAPAESRPLTILIVEDTGLVRRLMARLLALDGHHVIEAEDLASGREQAARHKLDLLLLDLHLPDGDGLALLQQWPAAHERPPVIVLTAAGARETEARVAQAGATLLRKPIDAAGLRAAIASLCGRIEPSAAASTFDAEMANLAREARLEIGGQAAELVELLRSDGPRTEIQQRAHKLAGLAAQFGVADIAAAADRIEDACAAGLAPQNGLARLERILAEEKAGQSLEPAP